MTTYVEIDIVTFNIRKLKKKFNIENVGLIF